MLKSGCTAPADNPSPRKRASRIGPFERMNGGRAFCAPLAVATATCGLVKGLVPPIAGTNGHEATVAVESGAQAPYRGLLVVGSLAPSTVACSPKTASEANQKAVWSGVSCASLTTGTVAGRVLAGSYRRSRVEDGALDGDALITDWPGTRVDCTGRFDRGGIRDRLRGRWPGEQRGRQQPNG